MAADPAVRIARTLAMPNFNLAVKSTARAFPREGTFIERMLVGLQGRFQTHYDPSGPDFVLAGPERLFARIMVHHRMMNRNAW